MGKIAASMSEWTFAQKAIVVLAALQLLWGLAGFIAEPSFHLGADAPTGKVLGVDFNGYHALAGLLLFAPPSTSPDAPTGLSTTPSTPPAR